MPLGVYLFHDGVALRRAEVALRALKEHFQIVAFTVVPDGYFLVHSTSPRLIASVK